jgi:pectate lyase
VDQSAFVGQDSTFNVQASGTAPLTYQWYYNTNSVIANATNSSLTVTNAQLSDAGGYSVLVSNDYGSVTSAVAQLTVNTPVAPSITAQPQDQINVLPGGTAMFSVTASGSDPLSYQWYFNNSTLLTGATDPTLTITNVQISNAGTYSVVVNNVAGSATSSNAVLTVDTSPVAPSFVTQPASQIVLVGGTANFSATAAGTAPIFYQWKKDGVPVPGATSTSLTMTNVQNSDSGSYSLVASNSVGTATSSAAVLTVTAAAPIVNSAYNLVGFGQATTGGGVIATNDAAYKQVFTALDLANAIRSANKTAGSVKVIEIMNDLDLGWNEVGSAVQTLDSTPFRAHATPKLHPRLMITGVSLIDIKSKSGLTIFSANGSTIRHACFNVKGTSNIIIRNLKFDELWEWDEDSKGNYDGNDWDFIDLGNAGTVFNIWIDHCTFTKSYDGIVDVKQGSYNITFSWCKYTGDDGATNPNSFVWQQINKLESNKTSYAMYNAIRNSSNGGLSTTDIVTIIQGHDKTHLVGANSLKSENATHTLTFHHQWFMNPWDRCVPRLRAGNVHDYNIYVDDTLGLAAKRLRDQHTFSSSYSFNPFLNGSISTEGGAILVEKSVYKDCLTPLRNNQTDPSNAVYTGKIKALDTIYQFDSTFVRGNSTDPGNPMGPFQAPIIPFSWNLPGGVLPYSYTMDDPAQLQAIVTSPTGGAGAGVLTWNKTNWMMTSYAPTAPVITADPQSQTVALSNSVTFTVLAYGSAPMTYQWYRNTNTLLGGATNSSFSIGSVQAGDVGTYSVIVSNGAGTATSASADLSLTSTTTPFQDWQTQFFGCTNCSQADASADPDGDGMNNQAEFLAGSDPTTSASALRIVSVLPQNNDITVTWQTAGGHTNALQAASGDGNGGFSTNFTDVSGLIILPGSGDVTTNYLDAGGATNVPSRFYRVRLVP